MYVYIYLYISWYISWYVSDHSYNWQDCVCLVAPSLYCAKTTDEYYQFNIKTESDRHGSQRGRPSEALLWYARPQLFFNCTVAPVEQQERKASLRHTTQSCSATECPRSLTLQAPLTYQACKFAEQRNWENVQGRVPLMPCYIGGNTHPTLPPRFGNRAGATTDSSVGSSNGSRLYELNIWMWRYGRGLPRKVTVA
jgi:hypothetical protein